ncbi:MAG: hypothetical protein OQK82_00950 [Candidatus Pacearchaeota archaeon]|nr:hypothetical protein [Candidatus Pacearchaeota archaeon]
MPNLGNILFIATISIGSIILLWETSKIILNKKKITLFLPFIFLGIFFASLASTGFFIEIANADLFPIKIIWITLILFLSINLWRHKWN